MNDEVGSKLSGGELFRFKFPPNTSSMGLPYARADAASPPDGLLITRHKDVFLSLFSFLG